MGRSRRATVGRYWSRALAAGGFETWLAEPMARRYVNRSVTGSPDTWPIEWLASRYPHGFDTAVSLGCGEGALERDLRGKSLCRRILGIDVSTGALGLAVSRARRETIQHVAYLQQDLDALVLRPGAFDAAFFHQSLNHVRNLEPCLREVAQSLRPDGILYLDEYVGPSQGEWRRSLLEAAETVYQRLPRAVRRRHRLALPVNKRNPSEAVRSSEILSALEIDFSIELRRDYGGSLLSVIWPHLDFSRASAQQRESIIAALIAAERAYLARGGLSFYSVVVARPRHSAAGRAVDRGQ